MTTISSTPNPGISRVEHAGQTILVPSDLCLADHADGKTTWQRLADVLDTDPESGGRVLWAQCDRRPRAGALDTPWWELTGFLTLTHWGFALGGEREYDGPTSFSVGIELGPWSLWLSRHRAESA